MKTIRILLLVFIMVLSASLMAADETPTIRLNINNKSGYVAYVSMDAVDFEQPYRFTIPLGSRADIETMSYDVLKGEYIVVVNYYKEAEAGFPQVWIHRTIKTMTFSKHNSKLNLLPPIVINYCGTSLSDPNCIPQLTVGASGMFFKFNPDGFWFEKHYSK